MQKKVALVALLCAGLPLLGCQQSTDSPVANSSQDSAGETTRLTAAPAVVLPADTEDEAVASDEAPTPDEATEDHDVVAAEEIVVVEPVVTDESATVANLLSVGDPAPRLELSEWVKGDAISEFQLGQIYVVEFWATWCGPCRMSMPHLSELQTHYGDQVSFIGISDEDRETVDGFLEKEQGDSTWNETITYRLALDTEEEATGNAYMRAAQQNGIPTAFIVGRDGHIEWIGHPMEIDGPIEQIVGNSWDRALFADSFRQQQERDAAMSRVRRDLSSAFSTGNWDAALTVIDDLLKQFPGDDQLTMMRVNVLMQAGRGQEAMEAIREIAKENWDNALLLNGIAWTVATEFPADARDLAWAETTALRSSELTHDASGTILDTVARVYYEMQQLEEAIEWQEKAVQHSEGDANLQRTLERYQDELKGTNTADEAEQASDQTDAAADPAA